MKTKQSNETAHTPKLEVRVTMKNLVDIIGDSVNMSLGTADGKYGHRIDTANAIVRAVNAYEANQATIKALIGLLKNRPTNKTDAEFNWDWARRVKEAIAAAEGVKP